MIDIQASIDYAKNDVIYEILPNHKELISEVAECIAETFTGIQVGNTFIDEPITCALQVPKNVLKEYLIQYLKIHVEEGLTIIAKDKNTKKIIGSLISESYNPNIKLPLCEGEFESLSRLIEICSYLDNEYVKFFKWLTRKDIEIDKHIHAFMIGIKAEKNKKYIGMEMINLLEKIGKEKGYHSILAEITNLQSHKLLMLMNWTFPLNEKGKPIVYTYANDPLLKSIPENRGSFCHLAYKFL